LAAILSFRCVSIITAVAFASLWPVHVVAAKGTNSRNQNGLSIENIIEADAESSVTEPPAPAMTVHTGQATIDLLKSALDAIDRGDIATARKIRDSLPANSLDRNLAAWSIATSGSDAVTSSEIASVIDRLADWPLVKTMRRETEQALAREYPAPSTVINALGGKEPLTVEGVTALARAYIAKGNRQSALEVLAPFWRTAKLDPKDETAFIREFGSIVPRSVHRYRMERMHYENRVNSAERVASLAGANDLNRAWAAVTRGHANAKKLLDAVPSRERSAGYYFAKVRYLRRRDEYRAAARLLASVKLDPAQLIDPSEWWFERRVLSRELIDQGDYKLAYQVAANHQGQSAGDIADAEFHAGWYALRFLHWPKTAEHHFARIEQVADGAISRARGYYWMGRAAEAGAGGNAMKFYEEAARYPTAFYGQLAMAKLGRSTAQISYPEPTSTDRAQFSRRMEVAAISHLEAAGQDQRATPFYFDLAYKLNSTGELAMLAVMAENRGDNHLSLKVGKIAASRGLDIGALAHPLGAIPSGADISGAGKALAYAIARQESEFNTGAVSNAGARGLLQLMPGTAKKMARKAGLSYAPQKLTSDAAYNATLGSTYLEEQLKRFDGSYVLTFAGYNAGPNRAAEWVDRYGDPRGKPVDEVVDWVERIPYTETRNYVQRVMENYQVYKMRITGHMNIAKDLVAGR
jgi:soluble lytic murein transglycosylase